MSVRQTVFHVTTIFLCLAASLPLFAARPGAAHPETLNPAQAQALVDRAFAAELRSAEDHSHPMRYLFRKSTPRLTSVKEIVETRDGSVARLLSTNGQPLGGAEARIEQQRLDNLLQSPSQQKRRKRGEDSDTRMVMKMLRLIPTAFVFQYTGPGTGPGGRTVEKFSFRPNPRFEPPDLESQVLTAMNGELWIDASQERIVRIYGSLQRDTNFAWGILGRLSKGGWVLLEQSEIGNHKWRITRVQLKMDLRILFRTKVFDTDEQMSSFAPVPAGIDYRQAIHMLQNGR